MSTAYSAAQDDFLSYRTLQTPHPDGSGEMLDLHPFPALKVLFNKLGATHKIELGHTKSQYSLDSEKFVTLQYPIDVNAPTKSVTVPHASTETSRVVVIWVVIVYSLLLIFFIILAVGFSVTIHKSRQADASKANHVLYDNLNPAKTGGEDGDEE